MVLPDFWKFGSYPGWACRPARCRGGQHDPGDVGVPTTTEEPSLEPIRENAAARRASCIIAARAGCLLRGEGIPLQLLGCSPGSDPRRSAEDQQALSARRANGPSCTGNTPRHTEPARLTGETIASAALARSRRASRSLQMAPPWPASTASIACCSSRSRSDPPPSPRSSATDTPRCRHVRRDDVVASIIQPCRIIWRPASPAQPDQLFNRLNAGYDQPPRSAPAARHPRHRFQGLPPQPHSCVS